MILVGTNVGLRMRAEDLVFTSRNRTAFRPIRTAFETARRRAGLGAVVTPYVFRHTFALDYEKLTSWLQE